MTSQTPSPVDLRLRSLQVNRRFDLASRIQWGLLTLFAIALPSCNLLPKENADAQSNPSGAAQSQAAVAVDVAIAATAPLTETLR